MATTEERIAVLNKEIGERVTELNELVISELRAVVRRRFPSAVQIELERFYEDGSTWYEACFVRDAAGVDLFTEEHLGQPAFDEAGEEMAELANDLVPAFSDYTASWIQLPVDPAADAA